VEPDLAFATTTDGVRIAWTSIGRGPTLIHLPGVPFSNVEGEWQVPVLRRAYTELGEQLRLIQYDGRGTGRSQRVVTDLSHEAFVRDLDAVIEAAGVEHVVLLGFYHSASQAITWAARHPERVRGLILFGATARGADAMAGTGTQALLSLIERDWDTFIESIAHAWLGWPVGEEGKLAADWFRTSTTPAVARATLQGASETDVTADAGRVQCPVLVLHRMDATVIRFELSAELARTLPGGRLETIPGSSATLFFATTELVVDRVVSFVRDPLAQPSTAGGGVRARPARGSGGLSPRETEVLRLLAGGESNGQIASALGISINTVERHVANLYRKIDARGRAEATGWAIRNGVA
jgi:pimeloyl-ACP methyl ester carboxylesterase/DNA-binding CsgD family transcriptional regulator